MYEPDVEWYGIHDTNAAIKYMFRHKEINNFTYKML